MKIKGKYNCISILLNKHLLYNLYDSLTVSPFIPWTPATPGRPFSPSIPGGPSNPGEPGSPYILNWKYIF